MLISLSTTASVDEQTRQLAALYDYLSAEIEPRMANYGVAVPAIERQSNPWIKTFSNGSFDAVFTYHDNNWYTRMPFQLNTISIFPTAMPIGIGWEIVTVSLGFIFTSGYEARKFTGSGLLVADQFAYRRFDQPLTA